jgi:hypothetical protein
MSPNQLKHLLKDLKDLDAKANAWLDKIPSDINTVFFDNPLVDSLYRSRTLLLEYLFESPVLNEIDWFLNEWSADKDVSLRTITVQNSNKYEDTVVYVIDSVDGFVEYLKTEYEL